MQKQSKDKRVDSQDKEEIFWLFFEECSNLRRLWDEYIFLYETSESHRELLDKVAKNFFEDLQEIFIEYILLNICKITDPAHSRQDDNLTVQYILELVGPETAEQLGLDKLSGRIRSFSDDIRSARNKIIVHTDKETAISGKMLGASSKEAVDSFWRNLQEFAKKVSKHYFGRLYPFDLRKRNISNAKYLLEAIKKSVQYDNYLKNKSQQKLKERELK